ncbi:hypothetical protein RUM43_003948 [Polyplax serrata]|uniref:Uncharacterized protein n=1 Tax=Polyplax serrata TaxID=468196 RepID=A0AAN8Q778_POLSC
MPVVVVKGELKIGSYNFLHLKSRTAFVGPVRLRSQCNSTSSSSFTFFCNFNSPPFASAVTSCSLPGTELDKSHRRKLIVTGAIDRSSIATVVTNVTKKEKGEFGRIFLDGKKVKSQKKTVKESMNILI